MRKKARRAFAIFLILGVILVLLPAEKTPATGKWLARDGLESHTVRIGRLEVRYVRKGQGPSVFLIHGFASSIYTWADVIGPLSEKFDVVALDLPGYGASSQPDDLTVGDLTRAVLGLMDHLGIEKAHFVGNSLGGAVSLLLASHESARVDRVVLLDSAGLNTGHSERPFIVRLLASRTAAVLAGALPVRRLLTGATLRQLFHDDTRVTDERIDEYVAPLQRPGALESTRSLLLSRLDPRFAADLSAVQAKTLVLWGRFDPWLPESHADGFVSRLKGSRKVILDAGHLPQEEKPAEVARLIAEFLVS